VDSASADISFLLGTFFLGKCFFEVVEVGAEGDGSVDVLITND
jgi:hypothetical protein